MFLNIFSTIFLSKMDEARCCAACWGALRRNEEVFTEKFHLYSRSRFNENEKHNKDVLRLRAEGGGGRGSINYFLYSLRARRFFCRKIH